MKKKKLLALALTAALLLVLAVPALAQEQASEEEKVLNVFTWESYIDYDTILAPFTEETGIQINYATFGSNEEMLAKLQATGGADYDLVLASDYVLDALRQEGLIQPLDKAKIPNFANLKASSLNLYFDPESAYVVPYIIGTPVIVYDPAKVDFEITGYEDLWNPALKDSVVVIDDARNIIGITLKTLGQSFNVTDPAILAQAAEKLTSLRPNIRVFDYDTPHLQVTSGEVSVGYMFTPFAALARSERPDLKEVYPKEGIGIGIDGLVIPAKAAHPGNANLFLDFLLRPEIGVQIATVQLYNNVNAASEPLLPEIFREEPALNVPEDLLKDAEFIHFLGTEDEAKFQEIWTAFKQQ
jgi:spermidine/putrescine transport system substrate-binding protein